jgi:hypothetical protein
VHKTGNVLGKLPKSQQPKAKQALQEIWMTETKAEAEAAFDAFVESYQVKYEKAAECLNKERSRRAMSVGRASPGATASSVAGPFPPVSDEQQTISGRLWLYRLRQRLKLPPGGGVPSRGREAAAIRKRYEIAQVYPSPSVFV